MLAGDDTAFSELYQQHSPALLAFLRARLRFNDADDVHAEVWLKFTRNPPKKTEQHVRGWLFTVARNELANYHRPGQRGHNLFTDGAEYEIPASDPEIEGDETERRKTDLTDCLDRLDQKFADPLRLWMRGNRHEQIARELNILVETSHTQVGRGKQKVKDCMQGKGWKA